MFRMEQFYFDTKDSTKSTPSSWKNFFTERGERKANFFLFFCFFFETSALFFSLFSLLCVLHPKRSLFDLTAPFWRRLKALQSSSSIFPHYKVIHNTHAPINSYLVNARKNRTRDDICAKQKARKRPLKKWARRDLPGVLPRLLRETMTRRPPMGL